VLTLTILFTAVGLAMDAVAVSIASGLSVRQLRFRDAFAMALCFGLFQSVMPFIGFMLGLGIAKWIVAYSAWIVCAVLVILGIKMIQEAYANDDAPIHSPFRLNKMIVLAIATSIDAFAVGVGFSLLDSGLLVTCATIGIVTFALCLPAVWFGAKLGQHAAKRAEIFGGLVLITIGSKILIEHLITGG
jgi:manganese efflux pump family protein